MIYNDDKKCDYYARKYFRNYFDEDDQYDRLYRFDEGWCSMTVRSIPVQDETKIVDDGLCLRYAKPNYRRHGTVVKNLLEISGGYGGRKVGFYIDVSQCWHGDGYGQNLNELNACSTRPAMKI